MSTPESGLIFLWFGLIANIPARYRLCDGTNDTPDLRNRTPVAAGDTYSVNDSGGSVNHTHTFTADGHNHLVILASGLPTGPDYDRFTSTDPIVGTTGNQNSRLPYRALAYIMRK